VGGDRGGGGGGGGERRGGVPSKSHCIAAMGRDGGDRRAAGLRASVGGGFEEAGVTTRWTEMRARMRGRGGPACTAFIAGCIAGAREDRRRRTVCGCRAAEVVPGLARGGLPAGGRGRSDGAGLRGDERRCRVWRRGRPGRQRRATEGRSGRGWERVEGAGGGGAGCTQVSTPYDFAPASSYWNGIGRRARRCALDEAALGGGSRRGGRRKRAEEAARSSYRRPWTLGRLCADRPRGMAG